MLKESSLWGGQCLSMVLGPRVCGSSLSGSAHLSPLSWSNTTVTLAFNVEFYVVASSFDWTKADF